MFASNGNLVVTARFSAQLHGNNPQRTQLPGQAAPGPHQGPGTPPPSHRADGASALNALCSLPGTASPELRAPPTPALRIQDPTQALLLFSEVRANPKYLPHPHRPAFLPGDTCSRHSRVGHTEQQQRTSHGRHVPPAQADTWAVQEEVEPPNRPALSGSSSSQGIRIS